MDIYVLTQSDTDERFGSGFGPKWCQKTEYFGVSWGQSGVCTKVAQLHSRTCVAVISRTPNELCELREITATIYTTRAVNSNYILWRLVPISECNAILVVILTTKCFIFCDAPHYVYLRLFLTLTTTLLALCSGRLLSVRWCLSGALQKWQRLRVFRVVSDTI